MKKELGTLFLVCGLATIGCGQKVNFKYTETSQDFKQATSKVVSKFDILFVVDNSSSMSDNQQKLADNLHIFIDDFIAKGYDFQIAVTSTDAYKAKYTGKPEMSKFRDGAPGKNSGTFIITPQTPNLIDIFMNNTLLGSEGGADERAFESFKDALSDPANSGFVRPESLLSIIILSDEDDFSRDGKSGEGNNHDYKNPKLHSVQSYIDFLDQITQSTADQKNYSVNSICVMDGNCPGGPIPGSRYMELASKTNGVIASICDPTYAKSLDQIQKKILELSTRFELWAQPDEKTIKVLINKVELPKDEANGWTYHKENNSIKFHGAGVPPEGADVDIKFTRKGGKGPNGE